MAKDVITRFKLESTQYESKLRDASKGMAEYAKTATAAGKEFDKFTKANVEAAKALGNIAPSANNAKDKVKELVTAYNDLAKAYNALTKEQQSSDFGKAMAESMGKLKTQIAAAKQELYGMGDAMKEMSSGSSGFTNMLAVFGGNMLTKGVSMLTSELVGSVQESIELAKQGEGVRMAFERINKPGLLENLKEATHGTVSELELMKQAVKFENFKLSLDQMGTLLAFAQQQAKDTGQSVDYMVDSIVTGLGRKSLPILDNLGLSAAEIRERMKESGDMTTAVASIIKDRMEAAGGYVETAADRAARATAKAQDAAEAFGRNAIPIAQEWAETWATLSQGAMTFANTLLGPVARSIRSIQGILNSDPMDRITGSKYNLFNGYQNPTPNTGLPNQRVTAPGGYVVVTDKNGKEIGAKHFDDLSGVDAWKAGLSIKSTRSGGSRGGNKQSTADMLLSSLKKANSKIDAASLMDAATTNTGSALFQMLKAAHQAEMPATATQGEKDAFENRRKEVKAELKKNDEEKNKKDKDAVEVADQIYGGVSSMVSSLEQMGIELPEGLKQVVGSIGGVIGLLQSIMMIVNAIQAMQEVGTFLGLFKNGGIVPHAQNGLNVVGGNHYSGDVTPILANAGEVVLNRSQVSTLASQLQGGGAQNMKLEATVSGEQLRFVLNNNGRRTGRGEYVQSTKRS
jgi:hypothetical protein